MKKGARKPVTEVHSAPRKVNQEAPRRVVVMLPGSVVLKVKTRAFTAGVTMQKFLSELITKAL
jgi:predicted DNA binding CopG/RHH family protein